MAGRGSKSGYETGFSVESKSCVHALLLILAARRSRPPLLQPFAGNIRRCLKKCLNECVTADFGYEKISAAAATTLRRKHEQFPYYQFVDRASMYRVGFLFYAIYFIVSFPMFLRIDEKLGDPWDLPRVAVDALGAVMLVTIILDLGRIFLGPIISASNQDYYGFQDMPGKLESACAERGGLSSVEKLMCPSVPWKLRPFKLLL